MLPSLVDHKYCAPAVEEVPFSVSDETEQFKVPLLPALASGGVVFDDTETDDEAVHPFAGLVTVNV